MAAPFTSSTLIDNAAPPRDNENGCRSFLFKIADLFSFNEFDKAMVGLLDVAGVSTAFFGTKEGEDPIDLDDTTTS